MNVAAQDWVTRAAFGIIGTIHLLPTVGIIGRKALERGYGVRLDSPELVLLLQHRAVLFGILGVACWVSVWESQWRDAVWCALLVSTVSFMALAHASTFENSAMVRVMWLDGVAIAMLLLVGAMKALGRD